MDNEKAKRQRLLINDLLDRCNGCPMQASTGNNDWKTNCRDCPNYSAIRTAGNELIKMENNSRAISMTVDEYKRLTKEGQSDVDIAFAHHADYYDLQRWKKRNGINRPMKAGMTVAEYLELHNAGVSDKAIAKRKKISYGYIWQWKKKNNINTNTICPDEKIKKALREGKSIRATSRELHAGLRRVRRLKEEIKNETDNG